MSIDPQNAKAHNFLGLQIEDLTNKGNPEALEHFEIACHLVPDHPMNLANLGRCYLTRNEPEKFLSYIKYMNGFNQRHVMNDNVVISIHANALQQVGREREASEIRQILIGKMSNDPAFYADEAIYQRDLESYSNALEILDQAVRLGIENEYLISIHAGVLDAMGDRNAASNLRMAQIKAGTADAVFYTEQAIYYKNMGQFKDAFSIIDLAYERGTIDDYTENVYYLVLKAEGNPKKLSHIRQSKIDEFSKNPTYYNEEALHQFQLGNIPEGEKLLTLAEERRIADLMTQSLRDQWLDK